MTDYFTESEESWAERNKPSQPDPAAPCTLCGGEAVEGGEMHFVCPACQEKAAGFDVMAMDVRAVAETVHNLLKHHRHQIPAEVRGILRKSFEEHLTRHLLPSVREQYETEIAEKVVKEVAA